MIDAYNNISLDVLQKERHTSNGKTYDLDHNRNIVDDMKYLGKDGVTNSQGWERNGKAFFKQLLNNHPEFFSKSNTIHIRRGQAPYVDETFIKHFPEYKQYKNEKLIHHHIGGDGQAVAVPESMHTGFGEIHVIENKVGITDICREFSNTCEDITKNHPEMKGQTAGSFKEYIKENKIETSKSLGTEKKDNYFSKKNAEGDGLKKNKQINNNSKIKSIASVKRVRAIK